MDSILIIDDKHAILESLEMFFTEKGYHVLTADRGRDGLRRFREYAPQVVILDIRLPDVDGIALLGKIQGAEHPCKVIMITAFQDMETTIQAMKLGAYDYIHKPLDVDKIEKAVERALYTMKIDQEPPLVAEVTQPPNPEVIIGRSDRMGKIFQTIGMLSQNRAHVLIQGATGTGKELIARVIHRNSLYAREPFVTFDCSAVVETLLESELFGHEKGAFTGAAQSKEGKIELAGNGTLFLDEIGELPRVMQRKFLGFLQRNAYDRVGGTHPLPSRCRIIAATNRNLADRVREGKFRQDLFYRLKVVMIHVPLLVERRSDIPDLVRHFLQKINWELGTEIFNLEKGVMDLLVGHDWPGNVRELENVLVEAVVRSRGNVILVEEIENILSSSSPFATAPLTHYSLPYMEKEHIRKTLERLNWNRTETAKLLGISPPTLRKKIRKYAIEQAT